MSTGASSRSVYALFETPAAVQNAVDGLRAVMVPDDEIVVMSSEPIEDYEFSHRHSATWMHWIAGAGGAIGLAAAVALLVTTQNAWPIVTSGMPIVAWWPNMIIMFELTMLGAILATVITLFLTAIVPKRGARLYDRAVTEGYILVGVENANDETAVTDVLAAAGGRVQRPR
jgi:hypothetical protein